LSVSPAELTAAAAASRVADFALLRVAVLPLDVLTAMAPPQTSLAIEAAATAAETMEQHREELENALHGVIPRLDRDQRRQAIALRRLIHQGAAPAKNEWRGEELDPATRNSLQTWLGAASRLRSLLATAENLLPRELEEWCSARLREATSSDEFRRGLALASADLSEALGRPWSDRVTRGLFAYVMRAAAKTSPFGAFMHHALVTLDGCKPLQFGALLVRRSVDRGAIAALHRAALGCCGDPAHAQLRRNVTLSFDGTHAAGLVTDMQTVAGRLWRGERPARFRMMPQVWRALENLRPRFSLVDLRAALEAQEVAAAQAESGALRLLQSGVVEVVPLCDPHEERPQDVYFDILQRCASATAAVVRECLTDLPGQPATFRRAWATVTSERSPEVNVVMEDAVIARAGSLPRETAELLDELSRQLRRVVRYRPEALHLADAFLERFGPTGRCRDVVGFFVDSFSRTPRPHAGDASVPDNVIVPVTAFVQMAGARLVINQLHGGAAWLAARYAGLDAAGDLRASLQRRLTELAAPHEPVSVTFSGDCNPLQSMPRLTSRSIRWPGEVSGAPFLDIDDLSLVFDPLARSLRLLDRDGRTIVPFYLGGTVPSAASGPKFLLSVLAQPFIVRSPFLPRIVQDIEHFTTLEERGIVWRRETWCMSADRLRRRWFAPSGARRLYEIERDRRALGMARVLYATPLLPELVPGDASGHKPLWIDTRNSLSIDLLDRSCRRAEAVALSVAFPDADTTAVRIDGRPHAAEIMVELTV
jgi:hypothetical protein